MTRDEAVTLIKQILGFRTDQTTNIITNLQTAQAQLELSPVKPWFLISEDASIRLTISEQRIRVPSDFLEEDEADALVYVPDDGTSEVALIKEDLDQLRVAFKDTEPGTPEYYALSGEYFRIFPVPDDTYLVRMLYYKRDAVLTSNIENKWLKWVPYYLIGKAGELSATSLRDKTALMQFKTMANEGLLLLNTQNEARKHANRGYQIGGPH